METPASAPESTQSLTTTETKVVEDRLVAPVWHTITLALLLVSIGVLSAWGFKNLPAPKSGTLPQYWQNIIMQWTLFAFVVFGLRRKGVRIRDIMGRRWESFDDVLVDIALAFAVFIASVAVRAAIVFAIIRVTGTTPSMQDAIKSVERLIPRTPAEIAVAMMLALTAGIVEEFIFRGYLQRQFIAMTKSTAAGIMLSLTIFFIGHLYQGFSLQLGFVTLLGLALALLAHWRKSLRPGIILHAGQDMISLLFLSLFAQSLVK